MSRRTRQDYDKAFAVVKAVIGEWDPFGLFGGGAPDDEWDSEVASIVAQIPRIGGGRDAAHAVSRVFASSLERDRFGPDECDIVGKKLFDALVEAAILDGK
jgi:hypothetical protein